MLCVVWWWDVLFVKGMDFSSKNAHLLNFSCIFSQGLLARAAPRSSRSWNWNSDSFISLRNKAGHLGMFNQVRGWTWSTKWNCLVWNKENNHTTPQTNLEGMYLIFHTQTCYSLSLIKNPITSIYMDNFEQEVNPLINQILFQAKRTIICFICEMFGSFLISFN